MLRAHFNLVESVLLATSEVVSTAGHKLHRGTPREAFIRQFLEGHLPQNLCFGSGEIIDCNSKPRSKRNQIDIVITHAGFPKMHLGGSIDAFMCESVVTTMEVKSLLDKKALKQAVVAARRIKRLERSPTKNPLNRIYSVLVAYGCKRSMGGVYEMLSEVHQAERIRFDNLPDDMMSRTLVPAPTLDVIVVLGKGYLYCDTCPFGLFPEEARMRIPGTRWIWVDQDRGSLLLLFLFLTHVANVTSGLADSGLESYLKHIAVEQLCYGPWASPHRIRKQRRRSRT